MIWLHLGRSSCLLKCVLKYARCAVNQKEDNLHLTLGEHYTATGAEVVSVRRGDG